MSARKYRPTTFNMVVGQEHITNTLKNAIKNQTLAQSYLFSGPRGVGKTTCARIFAKTINCLNLKENIEPCNECDSCLSFNRSASFNIFELDAASNSSVEDIRNLVDQVRIPPQSVRYKVYIIDEVHMLSNNAFNAFLKTLEEPPLYAKFILATTEKHKIIPTILSRCQIYDFKRITIKDITRYLEYVAKNEGVTAETEALQLIAQKADGAMRDALSMFDQLVSFAGKQLTYSTVAEHLNVLDFEYYFKMVDFLIEGNISEIFLTLDKILGAGFDGQHFINGLATHLRDLLICFDSKTHILLEVGEKNLERYLQQASKCTMQVLISALDVLQKAELNYKNSNNKRLHLEITMLQLVSVFHPKQTQIPPSVLPQKKTEPQSPAKHTSSTGPSGPVTRSVQSPSQPESAKSAKVLPSQGVDKVKIPSTISIKESIEEKKNENIGESLGQISGSHNLTSIPAVDPDEFYKEWKLLAETLPDDLWNLKNLLISVRPEIIGGSEIKIEVINAIQQVNFLNFQDRIINYLRNKLQNPHLSLTVVVKSDIPSAKPYTPDEVYGHMARKNPSLNYLRDKFGLTPDY